MSSGTYIFENIPERMNEVLRDFPEKFRHKEKKYFYAAHLVLREYIGTQFLETNDFLDYSMDDRDVINYTYTTRILVVGDAIFSLRSCSGCREICRRMKERSLREVYFEALAAKQFRKSGFDIRVHPEFGIKGLDFDFCAARDGIEVNVEVTAFTAPGFSPNTVKNTLNHKRKQLPKSGPAFIFCITPDSWWAEMSTNEFDALKIVVDRFFEGSKRVNGVAFLFEFRVDGPSFGKGGLGYGRKDFLHPYPRFHLDTEGMFSEEEPGHTEIRHALANRNDLMPLAHKSRASEFYRWVDSIILEE